MKRKLILGLFLVAMVSTVATAAERKGFYVGGGIGSAGVNLDPDEVIGSSDDEFDEGDTGYKVFGGWRFINFFGIELSYDDFGNPSGEIGSVDTEVDISAFNAQAVGYLPIGFLDIFGKVGYYRWDADVDFGESGGGSSDSDWDINYGLGVGFNFGDHFAVRAEYERFELGPEDADGNIDFFSASALFRF